MSYTLFDGGTKADRLVHHPDRNYFQGVADNLARVKEFYPGWTMRVYHNFDRDSVSLKSLCQLACNNDELDLCHAYHYYKKARRSLLAKINFYYEV